MLIGDAKPELRRKIREGVLLDVHPGYASITGRRMIKALDEEVFVEGPQPGEFLAAGPVIDVDMTGDIFFRTGDFTICLREITADEVPQDGEWLEMTLHGLTLWMG